MDQDYKSTQQWEFWRRGDDAESRSDDVNSYSGSEPVRNKQMSVSNLVVSCNGETVDPLNTQMKSVLNTGVDTQIAEPMKRHTRSCKNYKVLASKKKRGAVKEYKMTKRRSSKQECTLVDDLKCFRKSLMQELDVARETLLAWMRHEMKKLVHFKSTSMPEGKDENFAPKVDIAQCKKGLGSNLIEQNVYAESVGLSSEKYLAFDSNSSSKLTEKQIIECQTRPPILTHNMSKGHSLSMLAENAPPAHYAKSFVSPAYMVSPTDLPKNKCGNNKIENWAGNHNQQVMTVTNSECHVDKLDFVRDANDHRLFGIQSEDQFGKFTLADSRNLGFFDHHGGQPTAVNTPVPLDQQMGNNYIVASKAVGESLYQENYFAGLKMKATTSRFSGASHPVSEDFVADYKSGQVKGIPSGQEKSQGLKYSKDLYPN